MGGARLLVSARFMAVEQGNRAANAHKGLLKRRRAHVLIHGIFLHDAPVFIQAEQLLHLRRCQRIIHRPHRAIRLRVQARHMEARGQRIRFGFPDFLPLHVIKSHPRSLLGLVPTDERIAVPRRIQTRDRLAHIQMKNHVAAIIHLRIKRRVFRSDRAADDQPAVTRIAEKNLLTACIQPAERAGRRKPPPVQQFPVLAQRRQFIEIVFKLMVHLAASVEHQLNPAVLQLHRAGNAALFVLLRVEGRAPDRLSIFVYAGGEHPARIPVVFRHFPPRSQNRSVLQGQQLVNSLILPCDDLRLNRRDRLPMARQLARSVLIERIRLVIRNRMKRRRRFLRRFHAKVTVRACEHLARAGNGRVFGFPHIRLVANRKAHEIIRRLHAQLRAVHQKAQFPQRGVFHLLIRKAERRLNRVFGDFHGFLARDVVFPRQEVHVLVGAAQFKFAFQRRICRLLFQAPFRVKLAQLLLHDTVQRYVPSSAGGYRIVLDKQRVQRRLAPPCAALLQRVLPRRAILRQIVLNQQRRHRLFFAQRPIFHIAAI